MTSPTIPDPDPTRQLSLFEPVEIPLTKGYVALVDPIDADLAQLKWRAMETRHRGYVEHVSAARSWRPIFDGPQHLQYLHRVILERKLGRSLNPSEICDHIDNNPLNNCRSNLRIATLAGNARNAKRSRNNTSGYKGVSWNIGMKKWVAHITLNGKKKNLGYYDTPEEAYSVYCETVRNHYGEFARTE